MRKPKTAFLKISECIKVVKYAVKIVQTTAEIRIVMVSSVCGIVYKNVTRDTRKEIQKDFTVKTSLLSKIPTVRMAQNTLLQATLVLIPCS